MAIMCRLMAMYEELAGVLSICWFRCLDIQSCTVLLKQNRRSSCNTSFHYVHNLQSFQDRRIQQVWQVPQYFQQAGGLSREADDAFISRTVGLLAERGWTAIPRGTALLKEARGSWVRYRKVLECKEGIERVKISIRGSSRLCL